MDYKPIIAKLNYWKNYLGTGDEYRRTHDLDCVLTDGNLFADTIFSLWLPLRYTLNWFGSPRWEAWKEYEANFLKSSKNTNLKNHNAFLEDLIENIEEFLPEDDITYKLIRLFKIGQTRCNVMILPDRRWNTTRGGGPYYDYLPHYLYDLLSTNDLYYKKKIINWIKVEQLTMLFEGGIIDKNHIIDLAGTGSVRSHSPKKINLPFLIQNYIDLLEKRDQLIG